MGFTVCLRLRVTGWQLGMSAEFQRRKKGLTALIILTTRQTNFNDCSKSLNRITRMFRFPEQNIIIHLAILYFLNFAE